MLNHALSLLLTIEISLIYINLTLTCDLKVSTKVRINTPMIHVTNSSFKYSQIQSELTPLFPDDEFVTDNSSRKRRPQEKGNLRPIKQRSTNGKSS